MDVALVMVDLDAEPINPAVLDAEEQARAARFRRRELRDRFVAAHAALRRLLAEELNLAPLAVRIARRGDGKPVTDGVSFSLARSGDLALVAIARTGEVGVDLELLTNTTHASRLDGSHLTAAERSALAALPPRVRPLTALAHWTRKEAYLKATGCGLRVEPRNFGLPMNAPAIGQRTTLGSWTVADLVFPRAIGAVAASSPERDQVRFLLSSDAASSRRWAGEVIADVHRP